jgi:RNA polymerase sigma factor (sigma-70 family)
VPNHDERPTWVLIRAASMGDAQARPEIVRRYSGAVYARARRLTGDADIAADVAQEAMVAALLGLGQLRDPQRFAAWLATIVDRAAAAYREAASRRPEQPLADIEAAERPAPACDEPERAAERRELQRIVRRALEALEPRSRVAVELRYFAGMSCREVGAFLDVSEDVAKVTIHRARQVLKRRLNHMPTEMPAYPRTVWCNHGKTSYKSPLHDFEADEALLYAAVYHERGEVPTAQQLGMTPERHEAALEYLQGAYLVERQGERFRCRAPIITEPDVALLAPWLDRMRGLVLSRLEEVKPAVERVAADHARDERQRSTMLWAALHLEAGQRPFRRIRQALDSATPEKGDFGPYTVAYGTAGTLPAPKAKGPGLSSGSQCEMAGEWIYYDLKGHGQDTTAIWKFSRRWGLRERLYGWTSCFVPLLERVAVEAVAVGEVPQLIAGMTNAQNRPWPPGGVDAAALAADLGVIHAVTLEDGRVGAGAVPVVPLSEWEAALKVYDEIAADIDEQMDEHMDALRARVAHCSFADCDLDQVVHGAMGLVGHPIRDHVQALFGLDLPPTADMDWGCLLATARL